MSKRNYNPWTVHLELESNESVSHDRTEPNYPNNVEIEFDEGYIAAYMAYLCVYSIYKDTANDMTFVIASAMADFIGSLPKDTRDGIADYLRDDDDFKRWLCEKKDIWLSSSRYR